MKNSNSLRYRSLLARGAKALAISSLLLYGTGCRGGEDTGAEVIQPPATTEVMTTCTTFTSTNSTTLSTTTTTTVETTTITTMAETISMTQPITESQTIAITIEPVTEWVEPEPIIEVEAIPTAPITEYERVLLCNIVANEAGSDWISIYDKASVVACVMNRVNNPNFPNTIEGVLTQPYQFSGYYASSYYYPTVTDACVEAVDYYFNNPQEFGGWLYFEGNGVNNTFH